MPKGHIELCQLYSESPTKKKVEKYEGGIQDLFNSLSFFILTKYHFAPTST